MARVAKKSAKAKGTVSINFKGVESRRTPPEGDYVATVLETENTTSAAAGNAQIKWTLEISRGEYKGTKVWFYTPLAENSLWKLHAWLTAMGEEVPEDEVDIDLDDLVGKELVVVLTHDTYQGKKQAKITDFQSMSDYSGQAEMDEEDDKPATKSKKASSKPAKAIDLDELDEDELKDMYVEKGVGTLKAAKKLDEDELREAIQEHIDEETAAEAKASKKPTAKGKEKPADEDDEDDEKPRGKARGKPEPKAKKKKTYDADDLDELDEDELQGVIDESGIDVDLDDFKGLKKKLAAVKAALDEDGLLDD